MADIQMIERPARLPRVETGAVQFGDDWPGVFIRGDDALALAFYLEAMLYHPGRDPMAAVMVRAHIDTLRECDMGRRGRASKGRKVTR